MDEEVKVDVPSVIVANVCYLSSEHMAKALRARANWLNKLSDGIADKYEGREEEISSEEFLHALVAGAIADELNAQADEMEFEVMRHMNFRDEEV